ncbi:MAG: ABC transporter permease subunit [Eubacteriales bacterium]|jgi:ABC-2 type transport system permease protein|nr:ABC transporter permease subunit [Eubacteriales bacterium]
MTAIFKRELKSYFTSSIGYIYLGITLLISGWFFVANNLYYAISDMSYFFANLTFIFIFLVPMLTMRLFTEEVKNKTDQLLLTSPVTVTQIVIGKYFSASALFGLTLFITMAYPAVMFLYGDPLIYSILGHYLGFFLLGSSLIAIGVFVSASTESQITAAIISFVVMLFIWLTDWIASTITNEIFKKVIEWLSVLKRYQEFTTGILSLSSVVYFISFASVFIFLTVQTIEKKRWS